VKDRRENSAKLDLLLLVPKELENIMLDQLGELVESYRIINLFSMTQQGMM
jgi:hypothetical protein